VVIPNHHIDVRLTGIVRDQARAGLALQKAVLDDDRLAVVEADDRRAGRLRAQVSAADRAPLRDHERAFPRRRPRDFRAACAGTSGTSGTSAPTGNTARARTALLIHPTRSAAGVDSPIAAATGCRAAVVSARSVASNDAERQQHRDRDSTLLESPQP